MANELTYTTSLSAFRPTVMSSGIGRSLTGISMGMAGNFWSEGTILVATGAGTAIPLGQVTAPHWAWFKNLDATNYVTIRNGSGGTDLGQFNFGEGAWLPLITTATPWAVANTAAVLVEYLILSL